MLPLLSSHSTDTALNGLIVCNGLSEEPLIQCVCVGVGLIVNRYSLHTASGSFVTGPLARLCRIAHTNCPVCVYCVDVRMLFSIVCL